MFQKALEDKPAVRAPKQGLRAALRMRHHAQHVACFVYDSGYVVYRSVGVTPVRPVGIAVAQKHLTSVFQLPEHILIREVVPFAVGNGETDYLTGRQGTSEGTGGVLNAKVHPAAYKTQRHVPQEGTRQQSTFA